MARTHGRRRSTEAGRTSTYIQQRMQGRTRHGNAGASAIPTSASQSDWSLVTLGGAAKDFMDDRKLRDLSPHTLRMYSDALVRLEQFLGSGRPLDEITLKDLKAHMESEEGRGLARKTLKTRMQCVKTFFQWLVEEEFLGKDPSARLPKVKLEDKVLPPLSVEEVQAMLDVLDGSSKVGMRDRLLILLLADTGGRISEVTNIKLSDIDLEANRILITGKGMKQRYLQMSHVTKLEMGRYLRKCAGPQAIEPTYLFENDQTKSPITRHTAYRICHRAGEAAGIADVHPHRFRRTFASEYISAGGDPFTLQKELGHTDLQMVRKYLHIYSPDVSRKHQEFGIGAMLKVPRKRRA